MKIQIELGALAPDLKDQLSELNLPETETIHLQSDMNAISRCHIRGLITDAESDKAYKRLMKKISQTVRKHLKSPTDYNPLSPPKLEKS